MKSFSLPENQSFSRKHSFSSFIWKKNEQLPRAGFSLIEVILATAILMGSVVVLARLAGMGRDQAQKAATQTLAQQVCENTMNELLLGLRPLEPIDREPLLPAENLMSESEDFLSIEQEQEESDGIKSRDVLGNSSESGVSESGTSEQESDWLYSIRIEPVELETNAELSEDDTNSQASLQQLTVIVIQSDESLLNPVRFSLTRWIRTSQVSEEDSFNEFSGSSSGSFSERGFE